MQKKDILIAVLDPDQVLSSELKNVIEKDGFTCLTFVDYEQLLNALKMRKIDLIIMECMTQKASLDKVILKITKETPVLPKFIFTSLVIDKNSVKDFMIKVKTEYFFKKPIVGSAILKIINDEFASVLPAPLDPILNLLTKNINTNAERIQVIQNTTSIHGFDLTRVLYYLMLSQFNGVLTLTANQKKPIAVHFKSGAITKALIEDPKSFFGALLVDKNFITVETLETVLAQKSSKKIGERLVDANLVSPHVIDIVNSEQLGIRVGYLITDTNYEMQLQQQETDEFFAKLEAHDYLRFLSDWLHSKVKLAWLKTFFLQWSENKISKAKNFADISPIYHLPPLNRMPKFINHLSQSTSLQSLLSSDAYSEEDILMAVYFLLINEFIYFDPQVQPINNKSHLERLKKIKESMESQNHFEILGLNDKAKIKEIKKAYYDLSKLFHPDKLAPQSSQEVKDLTHHIFSKISRASEVLTDDNLRSEYLKELEKGFAEKILESESLFEEGKTYLKTNQPQKALPILEKSLSLRPPTSEIRLHLLWAKILTTSEGNIEIQLKSVESELNRIPPEDRHNSTYYFVKGIYLKQIGDFEQAEKSMKQALSMDSNHMEAKRELNIILIQKKSSKPVDIMNADLKDVVGMLFKKKK